MEKNIHKDPLGEYVRKSFEDYEEDPSFDMWDRVQADLEEATPPKLAGIWKLRIWQTVAAVLVIGLLAGLICSRNYYEEKIKTLSERQAPVQSEPAPLSGSAASLTQQRESAEAIPDAPASTSPSSIISSKKNTKNIQDSPKTVAQNIQKSGPIHSAQGTSQKQTIAPENSILPVPGFSTNKNDKVLLTNTADQAAAERNPTAGNLPENASTSIQGRAENSLQKTPQTLAFLARQTALLPSLAPELAIQDIKIKTPAPLPLSQPSRFYVGLHLSPSWLKDVNHRDTLILGRPRVVSRQEKVHTTAEISLKAGLQLTKHFGLESGIGFRNQIRTARHSPRFRFGDGAFIPGSGPRRYDFSYELDSYGGTAEVSLRMEEVDNSVPIPSPAEALPLLITTRERLAIVRIPLLLTASFGNAKWQAVAKAGLVGNLIVKNELDISGRSSQNNRFRPSTDGTPFSIKLDKSGSFFPGYQVSAGLSYRINPHTSLVFEPTVSSDFARKNAQNRKLPNQISRGLNLGLNYWF